MPGFTSEEVQAQIERFLTTSVESSKTRLGLRDTLAMRDAVYDMLSTSLLLRPDSFFYLVWLATNRLEGLRALQEADVARIDELSEFLDYRTTPIKSTTELTNARAAILELNAGLNARRPGQGVAGAIGPAVNRFQRSTERFVRSELESNVVRSGQVTETPEEIRVTVATLLEQILERHTLIKSLATAITEAVSRLGAVQLPESAVRDLVGRIRDALENLQETLNGDGALAASREAMLEILVMRTLLTKASSFRTPRQKLAPLAGDTDTLTLVTGTQPGSLTGTVSGPFNYDRTAVNLLRTQLSTPVTQVDVPLPAGSNARHRSLELTFPLNLTGATMVLYLNNFPGSYIIPFDALPNGPTYTSGTDLASDLDFLPAWTVTWDALTDQLVFTSHDTSDDSAIYFAGDDVFLSLVAGTSYTPSQCVPIEDIIRVISSTTSQLKPEEVRTEYGDFSGFVASGTRDTVDAVLALGADLAMVQDNVIVSSPTTNFELLGVKAGMALSVSAPTPGSYGIVAVEDNLLVLDTPSPATETATYEVGQDFRSVPDGARVSLVGGRWENTGLYSVAVGGGQIAHLVLNRDLPFGADTVSGQVFTSFLKISAVATGPLEGIAAFPADPGLTALGFVADATQNQGLADTAQVNVDLLARGVREGDLLYLAYDGTAFPEQTITSVGLNTLTFSPGIEFQAGDPTYYIYSARYEAWRLLTLLLQVWLDDPAQSDTTDFEFHVGRLIRGANPSQQIDLAIDKYEVGLISMETYLVEYVVPEERTILNTVRTLDEQGMDRALDLLLTLRLTEFFTMPKDSVSYATHLIRTLADTTREVAPVGKTYKSSIPGEQTRVLINREEPFDPNEPMEKNR